MSKRRELPDRVRSWLREDGHEDADRILTVVLDQLGATPQRRAGWLARRLPIMNTDKVRYGIAAAAILIVALVGLRFLAPSNTGEPQATPTPVAGGLAGNGLILVADGNALRSFNADGSGMSLLDELPGTVLNVAVSPDGTRLAYPYVDGDHEGLRVMTLASRESVDLPVPARVAGEQVSWSPDSQSIVFAGTDSGVDHLYVAAADGSSLQPMAIEELGGRAEIIAPAWSPDGRWIAFVGRSAGTVTDRGLLFLVRPDGSELYGLDVEAVTVGDGGYIRWAPDPSVERLTYLVMQDDGLHVRLHDVAAARDYDTGLGFWPSWSPDGSRISGCCTSIVKTSDVLAGNPQPSTVFAQFGGACGENTDLAGQAICSGATWSPDGTMLIAGDIVDSALLIAPADGSGTPTKINLETAMGSEAHVAWQPIRP